MAWNRASNNRQTETALRRAGTARPTIAVIAVAVVVLAAGIAAWRLWPTEETRQVTASTKRGLIREVTPAAVSTPQKVQPEEKKVEEERGHDLKWFKENFGTNIPDNLKATVYFMEHPPKRGFKVRNSKTDIFKFSAERQIAGVMLAEPGDLFIVQPQFDDEFDRDFEEAVQVKIETFNDDTADVKRLKEDIELSKQDLAKVCKESGRKPSEVMNDYAASMFQLGRLRQNLEEEIDKIHDNKEVSNTDVEDFVRAANKMLRDNGAKELDMPDFVFRSFRLNFLDRMAEIRAETVEPTEGK